MSKFKIEITSVPDREKLVAEIWFGKVFLAEISQDNENLEIEFYPHDKISFELHEFSSALKIAEEKLTT
jgi:N-acetyl-beta-hexosaminidase